MDNNKPIETLQNKLNHLKDDVLIVEKDIEFISQVKDMSLEQQFLGLLSFNHPLSFLDDSLVETIIFKYLKSHNLNSSNIKISRNEIMYLKGDNDTYICIRFKLFDEKTIYITPYSDKSSMHKSNGFPDTVQNMFDAYFKYKKEKNLNNFHNYLDTRFIDLPRPIQYFKYFTKKVDLDKRYEDEIKRMNEYDDKVQKNDEEYQVLLNIFNKNVVELNSFIKHFEELGFDVEIILTNKIF